MQWLQRQFEQSTIISGLLALAIWVAIIYLAISQVQVPEILYFGGSTVIGFFFGAKLGNEQAARAYRDRF